MVEFMLFFIFNGVEFMLMMHVKLGNV